MIPYVSKLIHSSLRGSNGELWIFESSAQNIDPKKTNCASWSIFKHLQTSCMPLQQVQSLCKGPKFRACFRSSFLRTAKWALRRFVRTAHQHPPPLKQIHLWNFDVFFHVCFFSISPPQVTSFEILTITFRPSNFFQNASSKPSGLSWCQSFHSWKANARDMPPKSPIKLPGSQPPPNNQPHIEKPLLSGWVVPFFDKNYDKNAQQVKLRAEKKHLKPKFLVMCWGDAATLLRKKPFGKLRT